LRLAGGTAGLCIIREVRGPLHVLVGGQPCRRLTILTEVAIIFLELLLGALGDGLLHHVGWHQEVLQILQQDLKKVELVNGRLLRHVEDHKELLVARPNVGNVLLVQFERGPQSLRALAGKFSIIVGSMLLGRLL